MTSIDSAPHGDEHTSLNSENNYEQNSQNMSKPEDDRKLFVGGLTWDTTPDDLREYFSNFGNILDCSIKHDPATGRSRGFAFLVFDRKEIVEKILSQNEHFVKGRKVDPKPAHRRLAQTNSHHHLSSSSTHSLSNHNQSNQNQTNNNRKVFIGGVDPNFPDVQLREYFSQFGIIDDIDLPYDKEKNERRPFCFISFQNEQAAQQVLRLQKHTIGDVTVDVKRAKPKTLNNQGQQQHQQQHLYDAYGQQNLYGNYGSGYGNSAYSTADPYGGWNAYSYNQPVSSAGFSYNSSGSANSGSSSFSQYGQHPLNSQYSYGQNSNPMAVNDYYSQYGYPASTATSNVYADPNAYNVGYDYNTYVPSMNAPNNGSLADNGAGQGQNHSPNEPANYENENHYGLGKASIVSSPNYQTYPIS